MAKFEEEKVINALHPGCKNCGSGHCCELHFDFSRKLKKEILNR